MADRVLLGFELSGIPAGAIIEQAYLDLSVMTVVNSAQASYRLSRLTRAGWVETEALWEWARCGEAWASAGATRPRRAA